MTKNDRLNRFPLLLDGATGSNLMAAGMPAGVCVEEWILAHPDVLLDLQKAFVQAGCSVLLAPTFGANPAKLAAYGLADQTEEFNRRLTALTKQAAGDAALVAGDVSPSGMLPAPMGDACFDDLLAIYDRQMAALRLAGVDLVLIETQMTLADARAALLCANARGLTAFVTITVDAGGRTLSGLSLPAAVVTLQAMGAAAVGLNCSYGPDAMEPLLREAAPYAAVPLIAKPNAGEAGQPLPPEEFAVRTARLTQAGAAVIGGCCGTTPAHMAQLAAQLRALPAFTPTPCQNGLLLADERQVYTLPDDPVTETFACSPDLIDDLMDADEETDLVVITLAAGDDCADLEEALPLCRKPICFSSDDPALLEQALRRYQGRAMICGGGAAEALAQRYGAVIKP